MDVEDDIRDGARVGGHEVVDLTSGVDGTSWGRETGCFVKDGVDEGSSQLHLHC